MDAEPGRPIFALGINGLKEGLANPLEDVTKWDELPSGSIVCVDECQERMPTERGNTLEWIKRLRTACILLEKGGAGLLTSAQRS